MPAQALAEVRRGWSRRTDSPHVLTAFSLALLPILLAYHPLARQSILHHPTYAGVTNGRTRVSMRVRERVKRLTTIRLDHAHPRLNPTTPTRPIAAEEHDESKASDRERGER